MEFGEKEAQLLGLMGQLVESQDSSPAAKAVMTLLERMTLEAKAKSEVGLLVIDMLTKVSSLSDPIYKDVDPMLKQSLGGVFKTIKMAVDL